MITKLHCLKCKSDRMRPTGEFEPRTGYIAMRFECMDCEAHEIVGMTRSRATEYRLAFPETVWSARPLVDTRPPETETTVKRTQT